MKINSFLIRINTVVNLYSRYLTKKISLKTVSTDIKIYSALYSTFETSVDWYVRTSLSTNIGKHEDSPWKLLKCDVPRNKSASREDYQEYEFYINGLPAFDTYDLKCVFSSTNKAITPYIKRYRTIVVA